MDGKSTERAERAFIFGTFWGLLGARSNVLELRPGEKGMIRGYIRQTWEFEGSLEIEEKHTGRYGAPGQRRKKRKDPTPEDIRRQNQWKRERDLRRLIKWNFGQRDYWVTLTYQKGERPEWKHLMKDMQQMLRKAKRRYQKQGVDLKYIYRLAIGRRGGPHIHILVNRFANDQTGTDLILSECWTFGHVNIRPTYDAGGFRELAEYIAKPLEEWEPPDLKRYHTSRNLIRKEPHDKIVRRRSLADRNGILRYPSAAKGYYVDPDSVRMGVNPVTGYFYRHYTLVKLDRRI